MLPETCCPYILNFCNFVEIYVMYHEVDPFKVYSLVVFSIRTEFYSHHFLILEHHTTPKRNPISTTIHSLSPVFSSWQLLIWFLSLWICRFWTFHINGITNCVAFFAWLLSLRIMFSRSIHVVVSVRASLFFMTE